jgi:hypothetical protein
MPNNSAPQPTAEQKRSLTISKILKFGIPLAISLGLCYYLFRNINFAEMVEVVKSDCDFSLIAISMTVGILGFVVRALRWRIQLRAADVNPPLRAMFYSIAGTYAINIVFPRLGELWRTDYIARRQKAPFVTILGSMIADRLADTLTVLLLLVVTFILVGSVSSGFSGPMAAIAGFASSPWPYIIAVVVIAVIWLLMRCQSSNKALAKIQQTLRKLGKGLMTIVHMDNKTLWLLLTVLLWGSYILQMALSFEAFSFTREIVSQHGFVVIMVCFVLSSVSMGIPSNGGFGPYQTAIILGLACYVPVYASMESAPALKAAAFANTVLGAQTLVTIVCGIISFIAIAIESRRRAK